MQPELLAEPVWREDVDREIEYLGEGCRSLTQFYERARAQGAPPDLLNEMWTAYQHLFEARRRLQGVRECFFPEPKNSG